MLDSTTNALTTLDALERSYGATFPADCTEQDVYPPRPAEFGEPEGGNVGWTTSFYTGMLWLAGELTGDEGWFDRAQAHVPSFADRMDRRVFVDHHDLGFLYSLSCVPAWTHREDQEARRAALAAADHLLTRVLPSAGIIQAWGAIGDASEQGRAIIDSLMNMPLLYWASRTTGDPDPAERARTHALHLAEHIVRPDGSTFHTFWWDSETGNPLRGTTFQGYSDDSAWARGQAWGIYGFMLNYLHTGEDVLITAARRCADYFLEHLPADRVPFWDLAFTDGDDQERDTSAGSIAVCGLVELARATGVEAYQQAADEILDSLVANYSTHGEPPATCLLREGVYHKGGNLGVAEGNLWGDYFYLEALLRRERPDWAPYWRA